MDRLEVLEKQYRLKKRLYEEREKELYRQRNKGMTIIEEVQDRSHYYLTDFGIDHHLLRQGLLKLDDMKAEVSEAMKLDLQKLTRKVEKLDADYYRQLREIDHEG